MKKLLLLLLCVPLIGVGQTAEEYFNKAESYRLNKEYQLAIDNYTKCIEIDTGQFFNIVNDAGEVNGAVVYNNRGASYFNLNNYRLAISDYRKAIIFDPNISTIYENVMSSKLNWEKECKKPREPRKLSSRQSQEDFELTKNFQNYLTKYNEWKVCRNLINNSSLYSREMQKNKETGLVVIDNIVQAKGFSKEELYLNAKLWIASSFKSSNDVIQLDDKDNGIIIVKGRFTFAPNGDAGFFTDFDDCYFTLKIYCKEERFRVFWTDFEFDFAQNGNSISAENSFLYPYEDDGLTPNYYRSRNKEACLAMIDKYNYNLKKTLTSKLEEW